MVWLGRGWGLWALPVFFALALSFFILLSLAMNLARGRAIRKAAREEEGAVLTLGLSEPRDGSPREPEPQAGDDRRPP